MMPTRVFDELAKLIVQELGPDLAEKLLDLHQQGKLDSLFEGVIEQIVLKNEAVAAISDILRSELHPAVAGVAELLSLRASRNEFETLALGGRADVRLTRQQQPTIAT